jgi:hypothetical protein
MFLLVPLGISIEFLQKSLKNYDFLLKKKFKQNFSKNFPLNSMSSPPPPRIFKIFIAPLARGTLVNPGSDHKV